MNHALKNGFPPFKDEQSLRSAIDLVCAKYGKVKSLRIFPASQGGQGGGRNCLCMLQLDPAQGQAALQLDFKVSTFGSDLAFVADVDDTWIGAAM